MAGDGLGEQSSLSIRGACTYIRASGRHPPPLSAQAVPRD